MILVIDDDPRRQEGFRRALGNTIAATNGFDAICSIQATPDKWTRIYLDCDGVDGDLVADCIAAMGRDLFLDSLQIIIHSSNYAGSAKMRDTLQAAGYSVTMTSYDEIVGTDDEAEQ